MRVALVLVLVVFLLFAARAVQVLTGPKLVKASPSDVLLNLSDITRTGVQIVSSGAESNSAWRNFSFSSNGGDVYNNYTLWVESDANAARSRMDEILQGWPCCIDTTIQVNGSDAAAGWEDRMVVLRYNVVYTELLAGFCPVQASSLPSVEPAFQVPVDCGAPPPGPLPPPPAQVLKIDALAQYMW